MKQIFTLLLRFVISRVVNAQAVHIEAVQVVNVAQPIAVVLFKWTRISSLPESNIAQIVAFNLQNSDKFSPTNLDYISQQPTTVSKVIPNFYAELGVNTVVIGRIQPSTNGQYIVSYQSINVINPPESILIQNQLKVIAKWLCHAAHTISNEVFVKLTGIRGAFCTRIACVAKINSKKFLYELKVLDYDSYSQFTVYRFSESLMSPAWFINGEKLAYVTFKNSSSSVLVIQTLATGDTIQIAAFPQHNGTPTFSSAGTKVAFAFSKSGSFNFYVMDLMSSKIHQITDECSNNTEPNLMADSQTLIYISDQKIGYPQIYK